MNTNFPLVPGTYYHIFKRGNNREHLFFEERNYGYFLQLYTRYIYPIADTFAYCLMRNHFHLLVRIKTEDEVGYAIKALQLSNTKNIPCELSVSLSRQFSNLFNAYSKAINKAYGRTGSLFEEGFNRIPVTSDAYFLTLVFYIHYNPQKHGFVDDFRNWRWSSYAALSSACATHLRRDEVLGWFGGVDRFQEYHQGWVDEKRISTLIEEDDD